MTSVRIYCTLAFHETDRRLTQVARLDVAMVLLKEGIKMVQGGCSSSILAGLNHPTTPLTCESLPVSWALVFWTQANVCLPAN